MSTATVDFDVIPAGMNLAAQPLPSAIRATSTGLELSGELTFEEWQGIGRNFGTALQAAAWCIGDWLVYGENKWGKQVAMKGEGFDDIAASRVTSESYALAIQSTGLDLGTLKNYASACRSIPRDERNESLTFAHHLAMVPLAKEVREEWMKVISKLPSPPSVKRLRLSLRIASAAPHIVTDDEITRRGEHAGHDNHHPHLMRLLTVLRKTIPGMDAEQRSALKEDCAQLVELIEIL